MGYYVDLDKFGLKKYQKLLETSRLMPSREMLRENISSNFKLLEAMGIKTVKELLEALKTKKKLDVFSEESGISCEYLTILRREAGGFLPKPVLLKDIINVDLKIVSKLAKMGIKNTKDLFEKAYRKKDRKDLAKKIGVLEKDLLVLVKMSDLARIMGIGKVFARIVFETGIDTISKLAKANAKKLYKLIDEKNVYTKMKCSEKDSQYCIDMAKILPKDLEE